MLLVAIEDLLVAVVEIDEFFPEDASLVFETGIILTLLIDLVFLLVDLSQALFDLPDLALYLI